MSIAPPPAQRLFRAAAVERLSSPDGLDTLMQITTVKGWIALSGLVAVVLGAVIWGVFGRVPQVVNGAGIMIRQGGVYRVQSLASGQIDSMLAEPGARVRRGQTIAVVAQPELRNQIRQVDASLTDLNANRAATAALLASDRRMELSSIAQQQKQADEAIEAAGQRLKYLDARILNERRAVERGLFTPDAAQNTIALRAETQLQMLGTIARKQELEARAVQLRVTSNRTLFALDQQITEATNRLDRLQTQLASSARVMSPYDGIVIERLADAGQPISAGNAIVTLESEDAPVEALMFIPLEGKRIRPGMRVEMVPGGVRPEETGYFLGTVRSISAAPLSGAGLDRYLKNEVLVQQFTSAGGAYLVAVDVAMDSATQSGYKWTSGAGARMVFGSGTLLDGKIVVETMRPMALIIPAMRRWFGV